MKVTLELRKEVLQQECKNNLEQVEQVEQVKQEEDSQLSQNQAIINPKR